MARSKNRTMYVCQNCGAQRSKWEGRCSDCQAWNSLVEEVSVRAEPRSPSAWTTGSSGPNILTLDQEPAEAEARTERQATGFAELDRVLGGGLCRGSFVLVGGDPGIGKSTLLMQMAGGLADGGSSVLYVSGEESVTQTAMRARRLGVRSPQITTLAEANLDNILEQVRSRAPQILVIDSIQTVFLSEIQSAPGSVSQVRECAARLMGVAKGSGITVFLIGHVTKEGSLAGPKVLEHMVDTVLAFEGDSSHQFRLLRALKNRFGASNELAVYRMANSGIQEVANPSELFLEERQDQALGSAVFAALEGTRPLLCEVQALTASTPMAMPRRTSLGFDVNRVHMLLAVLNKHLSLGLAQADVFINVVGGLRLTEPAADLAVAAALISTELNTSLDSKACFFGEVGLTGEVRAVSLAETRIKEAAKLGFNKFYLPASNRRHLTDLDKTLLAQCVWMRDVMDLKRALVPSKAARAAAATTRAKPAPASI